MHNRERIEDATVLHTKLIDNSAVTINTLRNRLRSLAIPFSLNTKKAELQALCSLQELGLIKTGGAIDQKLVNLVGVWWKMDVKAQVKELKKLGLDDRGKRVDHIKALILKLPAVKTEKKASRYRGYQVPDDSDEGTSEDLDKTSDEDSQGDDEDDENDSAIEYDEEGDWSEDYQEETDESSSDSCGEDESVKDDFDLELGDDADESDIAEVEEESIMVMNWGSSIATYCEEDSFGLYLLLMSFYHRFDLDRQPITLPAGYSVSDTESMQQFLRCLPKLDKLTTGTLQNTLEQNHPEPAIRLATWIHSNFGRMFSSAPDSLKISGFSDNTRQFVVLNPPADIQERFDASVERFEGKTTVRFHGTSIASLVSILQNGFMTESIWTASVPNISWNYAFRWSHILNTTIHHPMFNYGVLLGLEVAGSVQNQVIGVPQKYRANFMVRYIFLLSPDSSQLATSKSIQSAMKAAYRKWPGRTEAI